MLRKQIFLKDALISLSRATDVATAVFPAPPGYFLMLTRLGIVLLPLVSEERALDPVHDLRPHDEPLGQVRHCQRDAGERGRLRWFLQDLGGRSTYREAGANRS